MPVKRKLKLILTLILFSSTNNSFSQYISTIAGTGECGYTGDSVLATTSKIFEPSDIAFDRKGNFYFAERLGNRIRKVTSDGILITIAGNGTGGYSGDGGEAISAQLNGPVGVSTDTLGNVYIADLNNNRVREVNSVTGIITTFAGTGAAASTGDGGPATNAAFAGLYNIYFSSFGDMYVVEAANKIRRIDSHGIISTVAGNGTTGYSGDGGPATLASLSNGGGGGVTVDRDNNLYIADGGNARVRKVNSATGIISTVAGTGDVAFNGDGISCLSANISPIDVSFDEYENLYICDDYNARIRKVNSSGIISTVAGNGIKGFAGDNGVATNAEIYNPEGVGIDSCGNLYIADDDNCRIRKVTYPFCGYLSVSNITSGSEVSLYPNPCCSSLDVRDIAIPSTYNIYDMLGLSAGRGKLEVGDNIINTSTLLPDLYLIAIIDEEGNKTIKKFVKQ